MQIILGDFLMGKLSEKIASISVRSTNQGKIVFEMIFNSHGLIRFDYSDFVVIIQVRFIIVMYFLNLEKKHNKKS